MTGRLLPSGPRAMLRAALARREVRFVLVGGTNTLIGLIAYAVFYTLWGDGLHYLGALLLAYAVGICVGFVLQRRLVFRVRGSVLLDLVRYTGVQAVMLSINAVLLPLLVEKADVPALPAQLVAQAVLVVTTYLCHSLFSFHRGYAAPLDQPPGPSSARVAARGATAQEVAG